MRVLFAAKYLDSGGITTHMHTLGRCLLRRGIAVGIVSGGQIGVHTHGPDWFTRVGIPHFTVPFSGREKDLSKVLRSLLLFPRVVRDFSPDVIHVHWRSVSLFAELERLFHGIPFVTTLHSDGIPRGGLARRLSFWGEYAIAISQATREYLVKSFGLPDDKVVLIHHGVDEEWFSPPTDEQRACARLALHVSPTDFVVAYVGRLAQEKRVEDLIKATKTLVPLYPHLRLVIAGSGSLEPEIKEQIRAEGLQDHVKMLGYMETKTVLAAPDVLCLPSSGEGFALVAVEAMMMGVPVIRTDVGGARDQIMNGVNGWLYDVGDVSALAGHLRNLLEHPALRRQMADRAHSFAAEHFSASTMAERTIDVYKKAMKIRRRVMQKLI